MTHDQATLLDTFHPVIRRWFLGRFAAPTEPQQQGWPHIAAGAHTLIAAPTGSGKTLTAFLAAIDGLLKEAIRGELTDEIRVVYVSPLRALSNDMHRNLEVPLAEITALALADYPDMLPIRAGLRTGDTPASKRASLLRKPPHILVTTPESLYLLLTSVKGRERLRNVETVIVDEIHALVRDKRGSHLALTLARLDAEHVHAARVGQLLPRVLFRLGLEHGILFGRIRHERHGSVEHLVADLQTDVRITDDVPVPQPIAGELTAWTIHGRQIELTVVRGARRGHRVRQPVPGPGLHEDRRVLVGEGPVGDRLGDEVAREPEPGPTVLGVESHDAQRDERDRHAGEQCSNEDQQGLRPSAHGDDYTGSGVA